MNRFEVESKCYEITDLVNGGKIQQAATMLSVELGLAFMDGQIDARLSERTD